MIPVYTAFVDQGPEQKQENTSIHLCTAFCSTNTHLYHEANYCSSCLTDTISYFSPLPCLIVVTVNEECLGGGGIFIVTHLRTPARHVTGVCACLLTILQSAVTKHKHTRSSLIRSVQSLHQRITINCHLSQLKRCEGSMLAFRSRRV